MQSFNVNEVDRQIFGDKITDWLSNESILYFRGKKERKERNSMKKVLNCVKIPYLYKLQNGNIFICDISGSFKKGHSDKVCINSNMSILSNLLPMKAPSWSS